MKKNLNPKLLRWKLKFFEMSIIGHHPVKRGREGKGQVANQYRKLKDY